MKKLLCAVSFVLGCIFTAVESYAAGNTQNTDNTSIELFHDGKDAVLAKFTIRPDWHIYWSNPGEIGLPTVVKAQNSGIDVVNQTIPQIRTAYETLDEYLYEDTAYFELKVDNLPQASIIFDFVECNDVCKPEKLVFDLAELPTTDVASWQEIKATATATFPKKIVLSSAPEQNEIHLKTSPGNIKFIPTEHDVIDTESINISQNNNETRIKWSSEQPQQLKQALIVTPENAYLVDIVYEADLLSFVYIIILAFLGGIILNAMPCVFPILSLKIFTLMQQDRRNKSQARINAFLYVCGVLLSFLLLTSCLTALKSGGEAVGWGFQLQSAWFVGLMALIFFILFLYMMEWIHFPNFASDFIHKAAGFNDFTTGFFAVLVASPCTGPFMGAAVGYAFMRSNTETFVVFTALALGYALPYALIELFPQALNRILPKPGKWMRKVKIVLAIPLLLTSIWLGVVWYSQVTDTYFISSETEKGELNWQPFDAQKIAELNEAGENIFIDFTADWCLTCKFNEKLLINTKRFKNFVEQNRVHLFMADLTENNEEYYQALSAYGRDGIPLYIYYSNGNYKILPLFFGIDDLR